MSTLSTIANGATGAVSRAAINAAIGWLNSQKVAGAIAWVDSTNGNDSTGEVGNPSRPYQTLAAAHAATDAAGESKILMLSPGYHTHDVVGGNLSGTFVGFSPVATTLNLTVNGLDAPAGGGSAGTINITVSGLTVSAMAVGGAGWIEEPYIETTGGYGGNITIKGDGVVNIASVNGGAASGDGTTTGGPAGQITLKGLTVLAVGAAGGMGAAPGAGGNVYMDNCDASACSWDISNASMHFGRTSYSSSAAFELGSLYTDRGGNASNY